MCDNSKCSKPVKSFKLKLKRKFFLSYQGKKNTSSHFSSFLSKVQVEGCDARATCERVIEFFVPENDLQE
jgi:hypothetical protein